MRIEKEAMKLRRKEYEDARYDSQESIGDNNNSEMEKVLSIDYQFDGFDSDIVDGHDQERSDNGNHRNNNNITTKVRWIDDDRPTEGGDTGNDNDNHHKHSRGHSGNVSDSEDTDEYIPGFDEANDNKSGSTKCRDEQSDISRSNRTNHHSNRADTPQLVFDPVIAERVSPTSTSTSTTSVTTKRPSTAPSSIQKRGLSSLLSVPSSAAITTRQFYEDTPSSSSSSSSLSTPLSPSNVKSKNAAKFRPLLSGDDVSGALRGAKPNYTKLMSTLHV